MKASRTYLDLFTFNVLSNLYIKRIGDNATMLNSKIKSMHKLLGPVFDVYGEHLLDIKERHAKKYTEGDKKGTFIKSITGEGKDRVESLVYDEYGSKLMRKDIKELHAKIVEVDSRISEYFDVSTLTEQERESFSGLIIPVQPVDEDGVLIPLIHKPSL
jgi:hypothetical protein